jgi:sucrose-phosphate synthase
MKRPIDILHLSLHGLIRGSELELGRDSDTGGQCLYVLELVKALSLHPGVGRVTLVTRRVYDRKVSSDYSLAREIISPCADIRRIEAGPRRYLRKEALWRHLDAFIDGMLTWLRRERRVPDLIHAHYADAGYVGRQVAAVLGVPFVFTGHSLGRVKRERLIEGGLFGGEIEMRYNLHARIEAEELSLDSAAIVCTSTRQEVEEQYSLYDQYAAERMRVIPPGVDLSRFDGDGDPVAGASVEATMARFLRNPDKPAVLAIARADERKNLAGLLRAFATNSWLRDHANLVLVGGNRDTIEQLSPGGRKVWLDLLRLIDDYDLHGICAIPKKHSACEVAEIYRWASVRKGVFVNPAFTEPFGLTLLEAAASGLPLVATNDGGPRDIIGHCRNGELVDPLDTGRIGDAIGGILRDPARHLEYSNNGVTLVRQHYTWERHVETYLTEVSRVVPEERPPLQGSRVQLAHCERWIVMPLPPRVEAESGQSLAKWRSIFDDGRVGFGIATRLSYEKTLSSIERLSIPHPAFVISGLGAEIRYGDNGICDPRWDKQVAAEWDPAAIQEVLNGVAGLTLAPGDRQHKLMVTYHRDGRGKPTRREIQGLLREAGVAAKVLLSYGNIVDVLPIRSGKDVALRYLLYQWGIDPSTVFYYGCYGNDGAVVRGRNLAAIATEADPQLRLIRSRPRLFHCTAPGLHGLFEGLEHYRFLEGASPPVPVDPVDDEMPVDELMP